MTNTFNLNNEAIQFQIRQLLLRAQFVKRYEIDEYVVQLFRMDDNYVEVWHHVSSNRVSIIEKEEEIEDIALTPTSCQTVMAL